MKTTAPDSIYLRTCYNDRTGHSVWDQEELAAYDTRTGLIRWHRNPELTENDCEGVSWEGPITLDISEDHEL